MRLVRFSSTLLSIAVLLSCPSLVLAKGEGHTRSVYEHLDLHIFADRTSEFTEDYVFRATDKQGNDGIKGDTGDTGNTGKAGEGTTIIIPPAEKR